LYLCQNIGNPKKIFFDNTSKNVKIEIAKQKKTQTKANKETKTNEQTKTKQKTPQIFCCEIEPNPSKERAIHNGDNPSFSDGVMKFILFFDSFTHIRILMQIHRYLVTTQ
jgi:hypothetical protein